MFAAENKMLQVMSFLTLSLVNLGVLIIYKPFKEKSSNNIEIMNECTVYLCNTATYCIMNDGTDEEFRTEMGDQLMNICILNMVINLGIVMYGTVN
tara:strand:- start:112 stop:399 length:288 start_codon:yes stop_codon:yes gene_type:complete